MASASPVSKRLFTDINSFELYLASTSHPSIIQSKVFTLQIYHFVIGSKVHSIDCMSPETDIYPRNHEFPKIVENFLTNPETQFSNILMDNIGTVLDSKHSIKTYRIIQYLILIDSSYAPRDGVSLPFPEMLGLSKLDSIMDTIKDNSTLEICVLPFSVEQDTIESLLGHINSKKDMHNVKKLVNIMDCTSRVMSDMYGTNTSAHIYLSPPDCLASDDAVLYKPFITSEVEMSRDVNKFFKSIRWINAEIDDSYWENYTGDCMKFYCVLRSRTLMEKYLYPLSRLWSMTSYSRDYPISSGIINFASIDLNDFVRILKYPDCLKQITGIIIGFVGIHYSGIIKNYLARGIDIDRMMENYASSNGNIPLTEFITREIYTIIIELKYLTNDETLIIPDSHIQLERRHLYDYLNKHQIN